MLQRLDNIIFSLCISVARWDQGLEAFKGKLEFRFLVALRLRHDFHNALVVDLSGFTSLTDTESLIVGWKSPGFIYAVNYIGGT